MRHAFSIGTMSLLLASVALMAGCARRRPSNGTWNQRCTMVTSVSDAPCNAPVSRVPTVVPEVGLSGVLQVPVTPLIESPLIDEDSDPTDSLDATPAIREPQF